MSEVQSQVSETPNFDLSVSKPGSHNNNSYDQDSQKYIATEFLPYAIAGKTN